MATQKERLEQVEKTIEDVQVAIGGLEVTVGGIQKTLDVILARLPEKEQEASNGSGGSGETPAAIVPRMDLPLFDGTDPIAWLAQAEQYFLVHRTLTGEKVRLALIAMSGRAMFWAQWVLRRSADIPWNQFTRELIERFGDSSAINAYEAMHVTRQTGSLEDYLSLFEERIAQLPNLPPEQQLGMFLGGLQSTIRDRIPDSEMVDVFAAIRSARRIARSHKAASTPPRSGFTSGVSTRAMSSYHNHSANMSGSQHSGYRPQFSSSVASGPGHRSQLSSSASSGTKGGRNSRLSPEQQKEYFAKGKCFKCGEHYSPMHKCAARSLMVILDAEEEEVDVEETGIDFMQHEKKGEDEQVQTELHELQLSRLSSNGFDGAQTLKLFSQVGDRRLLTMVDSGASHCFIAEHVAKFLKLPVEYTSEFSVVLGDGTTVRTRGVCKAVPFLISDRIFHITCYIFMLHSVDVILGVSWLAQLGDVTANWAKLTMEFEMEGQRVCIRGDPSLTRKACVRTDLRSIELDAGAWLLWAMDTSDLLSLTADSLQPTQQAAIEQLLSEFPAVTQSPTSLPPARQYDHRITLQEGVPPVSVRPYRYNHLQKDEMEKLVAEMLAAGIIQPSNSPYSSPVLLVRKKDGSWRFCVDYRALNKVTVADKYPIPVIQELLDELHGARWFTKLDLRA